MASRTSDVPDETRSRLEKGPAYGASRSRSAQVSDPAVTPTEGLKAEQPSSSWPTFRADAGRSGVVTAELPNRPAKRWEVPVGGRLSQPVVAAGTLLVSSIDRHTVHAFDAADGSGRAPWEAGSTRRRRSTTGDSACSAVPTEPSIASA